MHITPSVVLLAHIVVSALQTISSPCEAPAIACAEYGQHIAWAAVAEPDSVWALLRYVAQPGEVQEWFAQKSPEGRRDFVRSFWSRRAAAAAMHPAERFAEHTRRLNKARRWYPGEEGGRLDFPYGNAGGKCSPRL